MGLARAKNWSKLVNSTRSTMSAGFDSLTPLQIWVGLQCNVWASYADLTRICPTQPNPTHLPPIRQTKIKTKFSHKLHRHIQNSSAKILKKQNIWTSGLSITKLLIIKSSLLSIALITSGKSDKKKIWSI